MKILFFMLWLLKPISDDELTAIQYYKELQLKCVPNTLQDSTIKVQYKDSTYIISPDLNGILWVKEKAIAN